VGRDREYNDNAQCAQIAGGAQHHKPRRTATGQHHARAKREPPQSDGEPGQIPIHEPVPLKGNQTVGHGSLRARHSRGEGREPNPCCAPPVITDNHPAEAEFGDLRQSAERETDRQREINDRLRGGEGLKPEIFKHGAVLWGVGM